MVLAAQERLRTEAPTKTSSAGSGHQGGGGDFTGLSGPTGPAHGGDPTRGLVVVDYVDALRRGGGPDGKEATTMRERYKNDRGFSHCFAMLDAAWRRERRSQ